MPEIVYHHEIDTLLSLEYKCFGMALEKPLQLTLPRARMI